MLGVSNSDIIFALVEIFELSSSFIDGVSAPFIAEFHDDGARASLISGHPSESVTSFDLFLRNRRINFIVSFSVCGTFVVSSSPAKLSSIPVKRKFARSEYCCWSSIVSSSLTVDSPILVGKLRIEISSKSSQ